MRTRWAAVGAAVAVTFGGGVVMVANGATNTFNALDTEYVTVTYGPVDTFQPVAPCRLLDTRSGFVPGKAPSQVDDVSEIEAYARGYYKGTIGSASNAPNNTSSNNIMVPFDPFAGSPPSIGREQTYGSNNSSTFSYNTTALGDCDEINFAGRSPTAVVVNLTVTGIPSASYVTLYDYKAPGSKPYVSTLTVFGTGNPAQMNGAIVPLALTPDLNGDTDILDTYENKKAFRIYHEAGKGNINVIIDVVGYFYSSTVVSSVTAAQPPV